MTIGYLITGRMKSTRLPQKLTIEIEGRPYIRWMIDRLKTCRQLDRIIICTSANPQDAVLTQIAREEGIDFFCGDETDVIGRLNDAARAFDLDYALNITADCPLVSVEYIEKIIAAYQKTNADLIRTLDLPHGFFSYGLKPAAMQKVSEIKEGKETEVWGRYFTDTGLFDVLDLDIPECLRRPGYRLTLDYPEDDAFFRRVFGHFGKKIYKTPMTDILDFLDSHPEIVKINAGCKEKYKARWDSQNILEIKER